MVWKVSITSQNASPHPENNCMGHIIWPVVASFTSLPIDKLILINYLLSFN